LSSTAPGQAVMFLSPLPNIPSLVNGSGTSESKNTVALPLAVPSDAAAI
jgi:hypothetical protein